MAQAQVGRARLEALTRRERDCLRLVLDRLSSKEIGRTLGISPTSVDTLVRRAREKLGVDDRYAAAQLLADWERDGAPPGPGTLASAPATSAQGWRGWAALPPLASLNLAQRLMLVLLGAIVGAIGFGAMLTALAAL
jgi:DNA-binding CsgD family transcriptional regulator